MLLMTDIAAITQRALDRCHDLGFALAGVCDARPSDYEREFQQWLAEGKHGEMDYLRRNFDLRMDPAKLVPGAKSIICVADRYEDKRQGAETPKRRLTATKRRDSAASRGMPAAMITTP
jgi:epoxyqueuosine reductase QueG